MAAGKLTALSIARLTKTGRYHDGAGLYLQISKGGSKQWVFRYRVRRDGGYKSIWCGLGGLELVPLAEARKRALECRRLLLDGRDPVSELRRRRAGGGGGPAFSEALDAYLESHRAGWRSEKHAAQWRSTLEQHAAALMQRPVAAIDVADVLGVLKPIWQSVPETASRVRQRIEAVIGFAIAHHWRVQANPAVWRGGLAHLLPAPRKLAPVIHQAAVPWQDVPVMVEALQRSQGTAARCLMFLLLTAARSAEARGARWNEIDVEAGLWTIPASRMKGGREHRVPLSEPALAILKEMLALRRAADDLVFPGGRISRPLSDVALSKALATALRQAGIEGAATVHGLRATFRNWCADNGIARDLAEAALAHAIRDQTEAAYNRSDLLERRRAVMSAWGEHCAGKTAKAVTTLRRA